MSDKRAYLVSPMKGDRFVIFDSSLKSAMKNLETNYPDKVPGANMIHLDNEVTATPDGVLTMGAMTDFAMYAVNYYEDYAGV